MTKGSAAMAALDTNKLAIQNAIDGIFFIEVPRDWLERAISPGQSALQPQFVPSLGPGRSTSQKTGLFGDFGPLLAQIRWNLGQNRHFYAK
jgi:hypothetical protein